MGTITQRRGLASARSRVAAGRRLERTAAEGEDTGRLPVLALAAEPRSVREPTSGAGQRLTLGRRGAGSDRSPVDVHTHRVRAGVPNRHAWSVSRQEVPASQHGAAGAPVYSWAAAGRRVTGVIGGYAAGFAFLDVLHLEGEVLGMFAGVYQPE